ncbi:MAG: hypothetical protein FJ291_29205 [Planctomycetes bacterium]|nr:hypothetical protein [Planctomycetota bacterium]
MAQATYNGTVHGRTVVLEGDVDLPDGTGVVVRPVEPVKGSREAVMAAVNAPPHLKPGDVAELMRLIEEGKRPVRFDNPLTRSRRNRRR